MAEINWNLAGPGFDAMQVLAAAGQTYPQIQQREQQQYQRQERKAEIDRDYFDKLDARGRQQAKADLEELGQLALLADNPQTWDQQVEMYAQRHPEALAYKGKFSPALRQNIIQQAGLAKTYLDQQKVDYKVIPEGGYLQGFNQMGQPLGDVATQPRAAPQMQPQGGGSAALEAQAAAAIAAGADPAAVRARMQQMQGGAGSQAPRNFP